MVNLNYLRYFYVCAQSGTITKAASKLRISQPSLSMQIKSFEEQLGFHLFMRTGRSIQLTPRGQGLFIYASKIFEVTDDIEKFLQKSEPTSECSLKIGVSNQVERPFIAEIVGRLIKTNSAKNLVPSILSREHDELATQVADEEIDMVITNEKTSDLKHICTINIPVMLISANDVAPTKVRQLGLQNLFKMLEQNLILPTDDMILAKETKTFLKQEGVKIPTVLTSNILACISRAVQEKLGASFLPVSYVQRELKNGTLHAFGPKDGYWQHPLHLYTYKGNTNCFVASLSKILQDFSAMKFESLQYELLT